MIRPAYYFGCWKRSDHYLYDPDGGSVPWSESVKHGWSVKDLDSPFPPKGKQKWAQGAATLTHETRNGVAWTILAYWDNSVDDRPGSHSTHLLRGTFDFNTAVAKSREWFPHVWDRQSFHVYPHVA